MQHRSQRTVIVVDTDPATCRAISRIALLQLYSVKTFSDHAKFVSWIMGPDMAPATITRPCCLVIEVQALTKIDENLLPSAVRDIPKIYIGVHSFSCELSKLARMGFYSFIEKPCTVEQLNGLVLAALDHHEKLLNDTAQITERIKRLSNREKEVGLLVVRGLTNREIALQLGISIKTVKVHRARVMEKSGSDTLVDLVRCFDSFSKLSVGDDSSVTASDIPR